MTAASRSARLLRIAVALGGLVPVGAGLAGVAPGPAMVAGEAGGVSAESHHRYLSGLLLGIGLGFWSTVPAIEFRTARFRLLAASAAAAVVLGGFGCLPGPVARGMPEAPMLAALAMELVVTPLLCIWQGAGARHDAGHR